MDVRFLRGAVYPYRETLHRLEWIAGEEAHREYALGHSLTVASFESCEDGMPVWVMQIGETRWASLTFFSARGTPLREVEWAPRDGQLVLRSSRDLFYPDGDPGRRMPYNSVVSVVREFSADSAVRVILTGAAIDYLPRELVGADPAALVVPVPEFGTWDQLVACSAPPAGERFGPDATAVARALADADPFGATPVANAPGGWLIKADRRHVVDVIDALIADSEIPHGVDVLARGAAWIIPLGAQTPAAIAASSEEHLKRMESVSREVQGLLDHLNGYAVDFLELVHDSEGPQQFERLLREAGATRASCWIHGRDQRGVVRVWAGDVAGGTRTLSLYVVPQHWVLDRRSGPLPDADLRWTLDDVPSMTG